MQKKILIIGLLLIVGVLTSFFYIRNVQISEPDEQVVIDTQIPDKNNLEESQIVQPDSLPEGTLRCRTGSGGFRESGRSRRSPRW